MHLHVNWSELYAVG